MLPEQCFLARQEAGSSSLLTEEMVAVHNA